MGIIRNAANRKIRGRIGDTTYYVSNDRQIARQALNSSNYGETASRTISQQGNRVRWSNLVQFYKLSKGWMSKAFENKKSGQSDYNRFMQLNLANARIFFTKEAVAASACVVDEFTISQGSLRSINITQQSGTWNTDIQLGELTIGASTTIAEFSSAILNANNWAKEGMQISFVSYQQLTDSLGYPIAICTAYEVTLSTTDSRVLRAFLPEFCSQRSSLGTLGTDSNISIGGFAYIISQTAGGKTLVSTQKLVTNNQGFVQQYSSDRMRELAIYSYGLDESSFLDSGSLPVTRAAQPLYVTGMRIGTDPKLYSPNSAGPILSQASEKEAHMYLSAALPTGTTLTAIRIYIDGQFVDNLSDVSLSTDLKTATGTFGRATVQKNLSSVSLVTSTGVYNIEFNNEPEIHDE